MYVNQGEKKKKVKETSAKYEGIVRWIREQIEADPDDKKTKLSFIVLYPNISSN